MNSDRDRGKSVRKDIVFKKIFLYTVNEEIKNGRDPAEMYTERIMEILDGNKLTKGQLGLIRIASEAQCELDCHYENGVIRICAMRHLKKETKNG